MEQFILDGPQQLREAMAAVRDVKLTAGLERGMLLGMGGSALSGGVIRTLADATGQAFPWQVVRDYDIPGGPPGPETLVLALSYSGNTEETLAAHAQAAAGGACVVAVSAGGKLKEEASRLGSKWIPVPPRPAGFQPRFAVYFMFGVAHELLARAGLLRPCEGLTDAAAWYETVDRGEEGRALAKRLYGRFPVVYTPTAYEPGVAYLWKIKLDENSKVPALAGCLPEANHNEMAAFGPEFASHFAFVLQPDPDGHPQVQRRFAVLARLLAAAGYPVETVPLAGSNPLHKVLASLQLADWVSYYLALERSVDPVSIPMIERFKKLV